MLLCPGCSGEIPGGSSSCPACGASAESDELTVVERPFTGSSPTGPVHRRSGPRFATGTVLASRYRIIAQLGRGGMGEVYRADDLKLNQPVALKFLALSRVTDAADLTRFSGEVRLARQISHPNVCRVFDLSEIDGQSFLCMEYIDGEDLASLLRRIGRLPLDKALELACQLAAGLAAIHDAGLLHRDLKPANVMIDGRGRARITDFGLAVLADEPGGRLTAGTPAYMSPEQRVRGEANAQSDIYSLGLVLYEMFTGRPALTVTGDTWRPVRPMRPSSLVEIDPQTEAILLRCVETDPHRRPASALHVTAALTGVDPLSAAMAAGVTLSPEAVAAAPRVGSLKPALASAIVVAILTSLYIVIALAGQVTAFRQVPFKLSPEVLTDRARGLLQGFGYSIPTRDWAAGFALADDLNRYLAALQGPAHPRAEVRRLLAGDRPPLYQFWYRQSPAALTPADVLEAGAVNLPRSGAFVVLDPEGHLYRLEAAPDHGQLPPRAMSGSVSGSEWAALLALAGLDPARLRAAAPKLIPPVYADRRAAWDGTYPGAAGQPTLPIHIEAASFQGTPVWFRIDGPWNRPRAPTPTRENRDWVLSLALLVAYHLVAIFTAFWLALRNLRLGRGDQQGALRLAILGLSMEVLHGLTSLLGPLSWSHVTLDIAHGLRTAVLMGMIYLGFEPYARRLWPERIVSWSRLLAGRFRDPLVGRDVLIGCLLGMGIALSRYAEKLVTGRFDEGSSLWSLYFNPLRGPQGLADELLVDVWLVLTLSLEFMIVLLVLRLLLRHEGLAIGALWIAATLVLTFGNPGPHTALQLLFSGFQAGLEILAWTRFGLLAGAASNLTFTLCCHYPLTPDASAWYSGSTLFVVVVIVSLSLYGFATAVAGQPWFARGSVLDG
jgi:hypothetical protein